MNAILGILTAVVNSLWQAVAVTALVWVALRFMPRSAMSNNAATRCAIWWATLAVVLVLPVAPRLIPMMRQPPPPVAMTAVKAPIVAAQPAAAEPVIVTVAPGRTAMWPLGILAAWVAILLWRLIQIGQSYVYLRGVKRRAAVSRTSLPAISRHANLLISREVASPMAVGFLSPAVILPESLLDELSEAEYEHVLLHEAAHLARYDDWSNLAMRAMGGVLALHPVAIWILRRIEREREMACDDWVVARTGGARSYAVSLAHLFERRWKRRDEVLSSGIFGGGSRVGDRIEILLRRGRTFSPRASATGVIASTLTLCGLMLAGSLAPRWIAFAQRPARPSFEVASVKPSEPNDHPWSLTFQPGWRLRVTDMTLKTLIGYAYSTREHQVAGGPSWMDSDKYNIDAKPDSTLALPVAPPSPANDAPIRLMMQSLLAERFKLAIHRGNKEFPVYELVLAKGGSKLKEATDTATSVSGGRALIHAKATPMSMVVAMLERALGRSVIDKTGLTGNYDFDLKWTPEGPDAEPSADSPTLFTALREQLGLKLESARGPVEIIVVDHAEKPDAN